MVWVFELAEEYNHVMLFYCWCFIVVQMLFFKYIGSSFCVFLPFLKVECWHRVRELQGSIPSQGPSHTKDVIRMVPVVPLFSTEH